MVGVRTETFLVKSVRREWGQIGIVGEKGGLCRTPFSPQSSWLPRQPTGTAGSFGARTRISPPPNSQVSARFSATRVQASSGHPPARFIAAKAKDSIFRTSARRAASWVTSIAPRALTPINRSAKVRVSRLAPPPSWRGAELINGSPELARSPFRNEQSR